MTNEEAARIIKGIDTVQGDLPEDGDLVEIAMKMAIQALEQERSRSAEITQYRHDCKKLMEENERLKKALEKHPCKDAISRQAVLENAYEFIFDGNPQEWVVNVRDIKVLPPVTPVRMRGKWEYNSFADKWRCNKCFQSSTEKSRFCPNCGSDNREVSE